jgi:hypothetical protein
LTSVVRLFVVDGIAAEVGSATRGVAYLKMRKYKRNRRIERLKREWAH